MESVRKRDGRSLDHKALEDIRIQAVQRVEAGEAPSAVMRVMGFARTVIYDWLNKYRAGGIEALRALPIPGRPPKLTEQQRAWVYRTVTQNSVPQNFKLGRLETSVSDRLTLLQTVQKTGDPSRGP